MVMSQACKLLPGSNRRQFVSARNSVSCTRSSARSTLRESDNANARSRGIVAIVAALKEASGSPGIVCACDFRAEFPGERRSRAVSAPDLASPFGSLTVFTPIYRMDRRSLGALPNVICARSVMDRRLLSREAAGRGGGTRAGRSEPGCRGEDLTGYAKLGFALVHLLD